MCWISYLRRRSTYPRHCQSLEIVHRGWRPRPQPVKAVPRLIALEKFEEFRLSAVGSLANDIGELAVKLFGAPRDPPSKASYAWRGSVDIKGMQCRWCKDS